MRGRKDTEDIRNTLHTHVDSTAVNWCPLEGTYFLSNRANFLTSPAPFRWSSWSRKEEDQVDKESKHKCTHISHREAATQHIHHTSDPAPN